MSEFDNEFDYEAFDRFLKKGAPELRELFKDPIEAAWPEAVDEIRALPEVELKDNPREEQL